MLYLVDFDLTLFNTYQFFNDIKQLLAQTHQVSTDEFDRSYGQFVFPEAGGYDLHAHGQHLLGISADALDDLITARLDKDYLYQDASAWLSRRAADRVVVITLGAPKWQALKFHHAPAVRSLHKVVVATEKGPIIRRHLNEGAGEYNLDFLNDPYEPITLIDDRPDTFTDLGDIDRITGIRIARPGTKYAGQPTPPGVRHITSFGDLS